MLACPAQRLILPSSLHIFLSAQWVFLTLNIKVGRGGVIDMGGPLPYFGYRLCSAAPAGGQKNHALPFKDCGHALSFPTVPQAG